MSPLNTQKIRALQPKEKRFTVSDGLGLSLRIHPSGTKSWVLRLSEEGRVSDITIGQWPEVSLKAARQKARHIRKASGLTPQRGYVLTDAYRLWKNLKRGRIISYQDEKRRLDRYIIKPLGNRQIDEITAPLIIHTITALDKSGKRATLKRVIMRTREILDLAVCAGYIQHNPIDRLSRIFAPPIVKQMPAIDWRELPSAMTSIRSWPRRLQVLFLWSLCSMLRPGENVKIRWNWIDGNTLTIPASEMKKKREHRVPITKFMHSLLKEAKEISPHPRSSFVFPAIRNGSQHLYPQTLAKALHNSDLRNRLVAHGLRSIARSWLADNEYPFEASEACLSHVSGSNVSRAYQRSDYLENRRKIMDAWCSFVEDCARSAGLLPINTNIEKDKQAE